MSFNVTLLFPFLEIPQTVQFGRVLHPLDHLQHRNEVDVVAAQHLLNELDQFFFELLLALQPRSVEVEAERGAVAVEMAVEIMAQKPRELLSRLDVGARIHHVATRKRFVKGWVVTSVQLVHDHLPDGMTPAGAVVGVAIALVRHSEVERVGPDWDPSQRGSDRCVVDKELIGHHLELLVATNPQVRSPDPNYRSVGDVGESLNNETRTCHFGQPIVVGSLRPVLRVVFVCEGEDGDLMTSSVKVLHR